MKKRILYIFTAAFLLVSICACKGNGNTQSKNRSLLDVQGNSSAYMNTAVNAIDQAKPTIMVIPGDLTLKNFNCLKIQKIDGVSFTIRDYSKYLVSDDRCRRITSFIQDNFIKLGFPLDDFEQTLKSLDTQSALDMASDLAQDAKTQLLLTAKPDIILEMEYFNNTSLTSHDYKTKNVSYTLSAIDAYTNKTIATITQSNIKGESTTEIIQKDMKKQLPSLVTDIQTYFSDILTKGREVTVRINVAAKSNQKLTNKSIEGDTYADEIIDYIKTHAVKGVYKMQINTANQLSFTNVRIPLLNEDGTQYGVYDWTRDLQKFLRKNLGLDSENNAQGLGEITLTVQGI